MSKQILEQQIQAEIEIKTSQEYTNLRFSRLYDEIIWFDVVDTSEGGRTTVVATFVVVTIGGSGGSDGRGGDRGDRGPGPWQIRQRHRTSNV
uniref:Uncharacterized protein n=1 Tax=Vespula pensylvanica TaxID=30213 RepID=A0A834PA26_VESPE|nr:hypothetical protein H0235_002456 [Vespula pensylvanica]